MDLYDSKGHEQRGRRPGLVVGSANGMVVVLPLTSNKDTARFSHTLPVDPSKANGLDSTSVVLAFQVASLDVGRFVHRLGKLSEGDMAAVDALLKDLLLL